jgi:peptidoglycan pentaglycine glycine transferase (the first glycine)
MPLLSITNQSVWDAFVTSQPWSQFTQSWQWGEFKRSRGHSIQRLALVDDNGEWIGAGLWAYTSKYFVTGYWYAQRGPIVKDEETLKTYLDALQQKGFSKKAMFWRLEPPLIAIPAVSFVIPAKAGIHTEQHDIEALATLINPRMDSRLRGNDKMGIVRSRAFQPTVTSLIDLTQSEDALLARMHEKTRYNIRLAERHGVTVREATDDDAINIFLRLNAETAERDRFFSMPAAYIRATVVYLRGHGMARIRIAEHEGESLAASVEILYGDTVTYLYGASSSTKRNVMAPYALHWSAMRSAKTSGYALYDLHGVNSEDRTSSHWKSSWQGISRFKEGFGGERRELMGTWELPRSPLYRVLEMIGQRSKS